LPADGRLGTRLGESPAREYYATFLLPVYA